MRYRSFRVGAVLFVVSLSLVACSSSGGSGSRDELYSSLDQLLEDSTLVAAVTVGSRTEYAESTYGGELRSPHTVFLAEVLDVAKSDPLVKATDQLAAGDSVEIRMIGTRDYPGPMESLDDGQTYLAFLTPTGLPEVSANQYYLVGGTAGLYRSERAIDDRSVARVDLRTLPFNKNGIDGEGDRLPEIVTVEDLRD